MRRALVLVLLALTASCSAGSPTPATGPDTSTVSLPPENPRPGDQDTAFLDSEGHVQKYFVHAPPSYTPDRKYPLVLVFHGQPGDPAEMIEKTKMNDLADANDFLVVYPRVMWLTETVSDLLDHLGPKWNVDPKRVHATGFSRGGGLVYQLATEMPERFGSVAPVSAASSTGPVRLSQPLSLITFQGTNDRAPWIGTNTAWDEGVGCSDEKVTTLTLEKYPTDVSSKTCAGGTEHVVYTLNGMGHFWPAGASELIWAFFAKHPLPSAAVS
jgi:polyhydroxybutyrate depolymerase